MTEPDPAGATAFASARDRQLLETAALAQPDAALLLESDGRILWGNPAAQKMFGIPFEKAVGRNGLEFVHPDDMQMALLSLESVQEKSVGTLLELRMLMADGSWRLMEMRGAATGGRLVVSLRDITDRRRWQLIDDDATRFSTLLQNSATVMFIIERDGVVRRSSGGLSRLLGISQEWLEGRPFSDLVDEADHRQLHQVLDRMAEDGSDETLDVRLRSSEGDSVPFALSFTSMLSDQVMNAVVVSGHDVSDRVQSESDLREANSALAATLESTTDGIIVIDNEPATTHYNQRFADMWGIPRELLDEHRNQEVMEIILSQVVDQERFLGDIDRMYSAGDTVVHDVIECTDGRTVERSSFPQQVDGRVVGRVLSFRDTTEQVRVRDRLTHQAFHDGLTGLANQALFRDRVAQSLARLGRHGTGMAVLFIDLDDFKTVNDRLGHAAGDKLLVTVADRITSCLRPGDTAARLGGDEFAVLVDDLSSTGDGTLVAERILAALAAPVSFGPDQLVPAASIGVAFGVSGTGVEDILRDADLAMYSAKSAGKSRYKVFAEHMHTAAAQRRELSSRLHGVVERGELLLHFQPIVDMRTMRVDAMEALVRWDHPERGLLEPSTFISLAEEAHLIAEIGEFVLDSAVHEAVRWARLVGRSEAPAVSVNISARQLLDAGIVDRLELLLHRSGLHPANLILEVAEGALMQDPVVANATLGQLSRLGVRLAIDDFGTGYSSLAHLQQFPIDVLKVHGSFVDQADGDRASPLAQAIIHISHALGLVPVAEGVESSEQVEALVHAGCHLGQGFHLGRPVDSDAASQLVVDSARRSAAAVDQAGGAVPGAVSSGTRALRPPRGTEHRLH